MSGIGFGERWFQGVILQWMNEIIREKGLPFDGVEQEVQVSTPFGLRRYPDLVVWRNRKERKVACIVELKTPFVDAYDEELVEDGLKKANELGCWFFATWNVNRLVLWETFRPETRLIDRRLRHWDVVDIKRVEDVKKADVERRIKSVLMGFLETLKDYYTVKEPKPAVPVIPRLYPDEIMVLRLRSAVDTMYLPISEYVIDLKEKDFLFFKRVGEWFVKQGWIFSGVDDDFDRLSRQSVYLLINKLLFYNVLRDKFKLASIDLSNVTNGFELKRRLQEYFNTGVKLGYGLIFASDFLEEVPIPDNVVPELKKLVIELNKYDFSEIGDIIGPVFEKLIPATERHKLGQYFTRSEIVDIIIGLTVKNPDATVLDPACGSGTFLVRSYYRKKYLDRKILAEEKSARQEKPHEELLGELWGIDISKFPATLTSINLIVRKLEALENKPRVICRDFFDVSPGLASLAFEPSKEYSAIGLDTKRCEIIMPKEFDVVITNPPYTRQEEMEDLLQKGYKDRLKTLIEKNLNVTLGKRSSIYAYFFFWSGRFLKDGGRMGLITSNSWLDVDFGKYLQEYFLKNFKIICIIESKIERWFEDADVNTAITVLEKCADENERNSNLVKFVQLKKPVEEYLSVHGDDYDRQEAIEKLTSTIENCSSIFKFRKIDYLGTTLHIHDDDKIRIVLVSQADLWKQGYDEEKRKYSGAKWGKFVRAHDIFFKILDRGRNIFIPLKEVADIKRGFTTGANEFFYLTEEEIRKWGIEREYWMHKENDEWIPNYVVKSPKECNSVLISPESLKFRVLMIHKNKDELKGTNVLKYILWGEEHGYNERPTCATRKRWYDLGEWHKPPLVWIKGIWTRHFIPYTAKKAYVDQQLYEIVPKKDVDERLLAALLNSSITALFMELNGRVNFGEGILWIATYEAQSIPVINPSLVDNSAKKRLLQVFNELSKTAVGTIFDEIGTKEPKKVSLKKVKEARKKLDHIVMSQLLRLTRQDQICMYQALIDLVNSRIEKARSARRKSKRRAVNIEAIGDFILANTAAYELKQFPEAYLENLRDCVEITIPHGKAKLRTDLISGYFVEINDKKIQCKSADEAKYIWFAASLGKTKILVPKEENILRKVVQNFAPMFEDKKNKIEELLTSIIPDSKIRKNVREYIWKKLTSL